MKINEKNITVTHVNIRLSISILLLKFVFLEVLSASLVVLFHIFVFFLNPGLIENSRMRLFAIPLLGLFVLLKILITIFVILQWINEYYEISPYVIFHRKGVIFKKEEKYPLEHIALINFSQTVFGKLFNFGTISMFDERRNKYCDLYLIHNPTRYSKIIEDLLPRSDETKQLLREHILEKNEFDNTTQKVGN